MNSSNCEPITGARIGARPFTRAIRENIRTMANPLNRSRTMAMATTPPPAAPMPISTRKVPRVVMSVESAAPREAKMCTAVARISGILRPNLSLSGPTTSWPRAKPIVVPVSVSCTAASETPRLSSSAGKAGR